jgi:hypothetical protein
MTEGQEFVFLQEKEIYLFPTESITALGIGKQASERRFDPRTYRIPRRGTYLSRTFGKGVVKQLLL